MLLGRLLQTPRRKIEAPALAAVASAAAAARLLALAPVAPAAPGALVEPAGAAAYAVEAGAWVIVVAAAATAAAAALRVVPAYVAAGSVYAA